ncbi:MAG: hypothetical protein ACM34K_11935 [Bacillota bacterium]
MEKEYYILRYRLDKRDSYLIWYSDETDGVITNTTGEVISFRSLEELLEYASMNRIVIDQEETIMNNLDLVAEWIDGNDPDLINFTEFNGIWNLWTDIAGSTGRNFDVDMDEADKIYDKLFQGYNVPAVNSEGKEHITEWEEDEIRVLKELFTNGMAMFRDVIKPYKD